MRAFKARLEAPDLLPVEYLALAERRGLPLLTADRRLVAAVRKRRNRSIRTELLADLI